MFRKIVFTLIAVFLMTGVVHSQERQAANFVYGSIPVTFAGRIGFEQPGIGGGGGGEFRLPANFAVTEDFQIVSERKRELKTGKSATSTTGVQYHFSQMLFARGAVEFAKLYDERNGDGIVRGRVGGGVQFLNQTSLLPSARFTAEYFAPIRDDHSSRGVTVAGDGYYQFGGSPFAIGGKVSINYARFHQFGLPQFKQSGTYSSFEGRLVLNLSSIAGG